MCEMEGWALGIPLVGLAIVAVAIYTLWTITKSKKSGFPLADERTAKISGKAFQAGFFIGVYYLLALNFYNIISTEFARARHGLRIRRENFRRYR